MRWQIYPVRILKKELNTAGRSKMKYKVENHKCGTCYGGGFILHSNHVCSRCGGKGYTETKVKVPLRVGGKVVVTVLIMMVLAWWLIF